MPKPSDSRSWCGRAATAAVAAAMAAAAAVLPFAGCAGAGAARDGAAPPAAAPAAPAPPAAVPPIDPMMRLAALAHDSLRGRRTGTPGARAAAAMLARWLAEAGVRPAGDSGYFQTVPGAGVNVVGRIDGGDPAARDSAVVLGAHYDHLGVGRPVGGDSIYNGADDDASGVVAVVEAARALASGPPPRRTVIVLLTTGEEVGLLGTRAYLAQPAVPLARTVAELEVEMIGRPDPLAGGAADSAAVGRLWLTGDERSTLGTALRAAGIDVVADPRPEQSFFERSDNIAFARRGIPAHTLSSYNLHGDYHQPSDEAEKVDAAHFRRAAAAVARAARAVADGPAPRWHPGGAPAPAQPAAPPAE